MEDKIRIEVCEHTNKPVVQERFGEEWVCIHDETREEELENIKQVKKLLKHGKRIN
jgi:hypothetical protein